MFKDVPRWGLTGTIPKDDYEAVGCTALGPLLVITVKNYKTWVYLLTWIYVLQLDILGSMDMSMN